MTRYPADRWYADGGVFLDILKRTLQAINRSDKLEKSLQIILAAATARYEPGFGRAAIFSIDESGGLLEGKAARGPQSSDESAIIWDKISQVPFDQLLEEIIIEHEFVPCALETAITDVRISLSDNKHPLVKTLNSGQAAVINLAEDKLQQYFQWWPAADYIAIVPLMAKAQPLGVLLADNAATGKPITARAVERLSLLAAFCAPCVRNAGLHEKLASISGKYDELEKLYHICLCQGSYPVLQYIHVPGKVRCSNN